MPDVTILSADVSCSAGTPFIPPSSSSADAHITHISGMVAGKSAPAIAHVTQVGVQVLWQNSLIGSEDGCNVIECSYCPSPIDPFFGSGGPAARRWKIVITQDPPIAGDSYSCNDYSIHALISYVNQCLWTGFADNTGEPITLSYDAHITGLWTLSVVYADTTITWDSSNISFNCCDINDFGCEPSGFPCPVVFHPAPCAVIEPYFGSFLVYTGNGPITTGGISLVDTTYNFVSSGIVDTGFYQASLRQSGSGSVAKGVGLFFVTFQKQTPQH